jgi:hypothetical protein
MILTPTDLERQLNDFDQATRTEALLELQHRRERGELPLPRPDEVANMHCHTFFSFNGYGHSPASLAWLAKKRGLKLMGIVDFDVLDGVDEFLAACALIGLRGSAGLETRLYLPEFAGRVINSPGEPGVYYHMGLGFGSSRVPDSVAPILADLSRRAAQRNREMLARINAYLDPVRLDYDRDVLPLTPNRNATERHIVTAYIQAVAAQISKPGAFWADKLALPLAQIEAEITNPPDFQNLVRAKLMKRGGVGYVQPGPTSFPSLASFHELIVACGALPCATWLDGTSAGEAAMGELLEWLISQGVAALNIIPDRNWNIADPAAKQLKLQKLVEVVDLARQLDLPLNIGTEMNAHGQKLVDDFDAPELAPLRHAFLAGAYFSYGHTIAQRVLGLGYQSDWAKAYLPVRRERNAFYTAFGRGVKPGGAGRAQLACLSPDLTPQDVLAKVAD